MKSEQFKIRPFKGIWYLVSLFQILLSLIFYRLSLFVDKQKLMMHIYIFTIVFYILYKAYLICLSKTYETTIFEELPFAMCQMTLFCCHLGVCFCSKPLMGFAFFMGLISAVMAYAMPVDGFYDISIFSFEAIGFYGYHGLL